MFVGWKIGRNDPGLTMMKGKTMKTRNPKTRTSRTRKYIVHRIAKVSHQTRGADVRHEPTVVYSKMCAVRNHVNVSMDERSDKLPKNHPELVGCRQSQTIPRIKIRIWWCWLIWV
jgi:hypothetical protein